MKKLDEVPVDTITGKDLDYLCDMFNWNYSSYKRVSNDMDCIDDDELLSFFEECSSLFDDNMRIILNIINNPGGDIDE